MSLLKPPLNYSLIRRIQFTSPWQCFRLSTNSIWNSVVRKSKSFERNGRYQFEVRKEKVVETKREKQMLQETGNPDGTTRELGMATPVQLSPSFVK